MNHLYECENEACRHQTHTPNSWGGRLLCDDCLKKERAALMFGEFPREPVVQLGTLTAFCLTSHKLRELCTTRLQRSHLVAVIEHLEAAASGELPELIITVPKNEEGGGHGQWLRHLVAEVFIPWHLGAHCNKNLLFGTSTHRAANFYGCKARDEFERRSGAVSLMSYRCRHCKQVDAYVTDLIAESRAGSVEVYGETYTCPECDEETPLGDIMDDVFFLATSEEPEGDGDEEEEGVCPGVCGNYIEYCDCAAQTCKVCGGNNAACDCEDGDEEEEDW